ncbi:MAG: hypothetical protein E7496_03265 [Ruminococcus sp.]|nr:hypothetical protein [Ruminococcus sp.]
MIKKLRRIILLSGMSICYLTGCAQQTAEQKTVLETAVAETQEQSQTEEVTETVALASEVYFNSVDDFAMYQDYDSFAEAFQKQYPDAYLYQIPEECGYKVLDITAYNTNYRIGFEDTDGSLFFLEIDFPQTYPSIEAFYDEFNRAVIVEDNHFNIETERYLFEDYASGEVAMYGITGEENIAFALGGGKIREDAHEILKERYENLKL